ncbi:MAG TPA: nitrile hydratase accessory protein [bacterium]|nr:nitrile hydratase accessory protein [bacterium]
MKLDTDGPATPPRRNGELAFDAPWQARVFGLAAAVVEVCFNGDREQFRRRLITAIAAQPDRPYWDSWTAALEDLVVESGLVSANCLNERAAE